MTKTPGIVLPSFFTSEQELENDIHRRDEKAGFVPFDENDLVHEYLDRFLLEHSGVKGMKWGVRRQAKKDAKETARAKQFYGEGAGTRRKLIKAKVEGRSKNNPDYAKAFAESLAKQDMSRHAARAINERRAKDARKNIRQTTGYLARRYTGEMGTNAAFAAVTLAGVAFLSSPKGRAIMSDAVSRIRSSQQARAGARLVTDFIRAQGR